MENFEFQEGPRGNKMLLIDSNRLDSCIEYILNGSVDYISINSYLGYQLNNIDFLYALTRKLRGLHLPEAKYRQNIINTLDKLIFLACADNGIDTINLNSFPDLEILSCVFSVRLKSLTECTKLKMLTLSDYKPKTASLNELIQLQSLNELNLYKGNLISLDGIEYLDKMMKVSLYGLQNLTSLSSLQSLERIEEIEIEKCKNISDFEVLGKISSIKKIIISDSGNISSLEFVRNLPNLEFISFVGTNVVDGNLTYCEDINYVGFLNKKHYTHRLVDRKMVRK